MDFGLNEEQEHLAASVRGVIESRYSTSYVREMLEDPRGFSDAFWSDAADLGWLGLLVDERYGGTGLGPVELAAVEQEMGRGVVPGPFLSSAVLVTTALTRLGSDAQRERWLPRLADGSAIGALALQEARGGWDVGSVALRAEARGSAAYRLSGEKRFVPEAQVADLVVVVARTAEAAPAADGITLFLLETSAPGVSVRPMETIDPTRRLCEIHLDEVELPEEAILGERGTAGGALEGVLDVGRLALCAEMVGGAERALEMCTDYARTREQFGRPIGAFQAIQHKCADMMVQLEGARSMTFAAAMSLAHDDPDFAADVGIAKAWCSDTYRAVTTEGVQIHGGLGFTWELDMQLYYKRAKASETLLGDARFHRTRIADRVLGAA
jgi:alkylation response protein AidB-like acyl-CoA dehydrogenase